VPEGRLRELRFVAAPPAALAPGEVSLELRSDLSALQRSQGLAWRSAFVDWLGSLNRRNASLLWWGYTSTAKNLLSSPLGDECFGVLALERFLAGSDATRVFVSGAKPAQRAAMRARLSPLQWRVTGARSGLPFFEPLLRLLWQFARIFGLWCARRLQPPAGGAPQAVLFTYVDSGFRDGPDAFFGSLGQHFPVRTCHVAFVHSGYLDTLPKLAAAKVAPYEPLFGSLRLSDLFWSLGIALAAWWRAGRYEAPPIDAVPMTSLLCAALRWDLGQGGYFYNVLVYRAARRLLANWRPAWLIYPYENKALEKMLLLAARESCPQCRVVGYQHASITRRHATLLFAEGEAAITPLPDRIVTVGDVTRRYLEAHGRYPRGIFATGCALRQQRGRLLARRARSGNVRVLLALSSSRRELLEAVEACRRALDADGGLEFGIRTHPEFPVALLTPELRAWVERHAQNFSGSALASNLEWCDAVLYVSSTVALEALGRGRPVINLAISDPLDPDPVLDRLELHWTADTPAALAAAARAIAALDAGEFERRRRQALDYVAEYLKQPSPAALAAFLP
jgi:hypothetical protein